MTEVFRFAELYYR